jgi:hypothetical protein
MLKNTNETVKNSEFVSTTGLSVAEPSSPVITSASVDPSKVSPGDVMLITAQVEDGYGIASVKAEMHHDKGSDVVDLELTTGTVLNGTWQGSWQVHDTTNKEYITTITAANIHGESSSTNVTWSDPTLTTFSDGSTSKEVTFTAAGSKIAAYIKIPKGANVSSASMNVSGFLHEVTKDSENAWSSSGACQSSNPCSYAVDENWGTHATSNLYYSGSTNIYENFTIQPTTSASWTYKVKCYRSGQTAWGITYYWNYSANDWEILRDWSSLDSTASVTYTDTIPSDGLSSTQVKIRTRFSLTQIGWYCVYYEGKLENLFYYPTNPSIDIGSDGLCPEGYEKILADNTGQSWYMSNDCTGEEYYWNYSLWWRGAGDSLGPYRESPTYVCVGPREFLTVCCSSQESPGCTTGHSCTNCNGMRRVLKNDWSYRGEFSITTTLSFASVLESLAANCNCPGCTYDAGTGDCTIPINVSSDSAGKIVLDSLSISYTIPCSSYTTKVGSATSWVWSTACTGDTVSSGTPTSWSWQTWSPGSGRKVPGAVTNWITSWSWINE